MAAGKAVSFRPPEDVRAALTEAAEAGGGTTAVIVDALRAHLGIPGPGHVGFYARKPTQTPAQVQAGEGTSIDSLEAIRQAADVNLEAPGAPACDHGQLWHDQAEYLVSAARAQGWIWSGERFDLPV